MPGTLLLALYLAVVLGPIALAWGAGLPRRPFLDDLSSALALTAFAAFLAEFVLSGRFRWISGRIGMDLTVRFHQTLARGALAMVILHPFLYTLPIPTYPPPWDRSAAGWLRLDAVSLLTGAGAWIVAVVLVVTAIFRDRLPYSYEAWRLGHGVGALLLAGLGALHALEAGRYSATPALAAFWLGLLAVAGLTMLHVYLISPLFQLRRPFEVVGVRRIALRTWELAVARRDGRPFRFRPGDFVWLSLHRHPFTLRENPFSIASAPAAGERVEFVIRELGDFTRSLDRVRPGQVAWLDGPHGGGLGLPRPDTPGVGMIAGGTGVAPMLSILREMRARADDRPVVLLYGNRVAEQIVYGEELERLATRVVHVLSEPPPGWKGLVGIVDAQAIAAAFGEVPNPSRWEYLLCGPPPMVEAAEAALMARGVPARQIRMERFVYD